MRWTWAEYRVCTAALPEAFRTFVFELASHFHIFSYLLVGVGLLLLYGYCQHLGRAPRVTEDPSVAWLYGDLSGLYGNFGHTLKVKSESGICQRKITNSTNWPSWNFLDGQRDMLSI